MVDIHMHVTPYVDDGSRSIKESLEMLRLAGTQGVTAVIATPHGGAFDRGYSEPVRSRFVDFTGTDAHRMDHRPPVFDEGIRYLYENYDRDYIDLILSGNAAEKILKT